MPIGNFTGLTDSSKIVLSILMLLGRLELFTILVLFTPVFWRNEGIGAPAYYGQRGKCGYSFTSGMLW